MLELPQSEHVARCSNVGQPRCVPTRVGVPMKPMSRTATRFLALAVSVGAAAPQAWAKGKTDKADASDDVKVEDDADAKPASKKKSSDTGGGELKKQDLSGHDLGTTKKENVFERDRFFVDKTDTAKTEKGTLVQGSITSTTF